MEPIFAETIDELFLPPADSLVSGPVFLVKENDVISEQTFFIIVEVVEATPSNQNNINRARRCEDFEISNAISVIHFPPDEQRIAIHFTLLPDNIPECNESFLATSAPESGGIDYTGMLFDVPLFLPPDTLSDTTYIILEDNDCKFHRSRIIAYM